MPTFEDPIADADELSAAARGLAHATRWFAEPSNSYAVLGNLQSALISLHQSLQQIADLHTQLADRATNDDGDRAAGYEHALVAATGLGIAAVHVERATDSLMVAFSESGRIVWQPAPESSPVQELLAERAEEIDPSTGSTGSVQRPESPPGPGR